VQDARSDGRLNIQKTTQLAQLTPERLGIFFAMREIQPEDLDEEMIDDFLQAID
jgi:hypothetical protein